MSEEHGTWLIFQSTLIKYSTKIERIWTIVDKIIVLKHWMIIRTVPFFPFTFGTALSLYSCFSVSLFSSLYLFCQNQRTWQPFCCDCVSNWFLIHFSDIRPIFFFLTHKRRKKRVTFKKETKIIWNKKRERESLNNIYFSCIQHQLGHLLAGRTKYRQSIFYKWKPFGLNI